MELKKQYEEKTILSPHDDELAIISLLKTCCDGNARMPLMNVFKGIPIVTSSELLAVNDKYAQFKTTALQIAAINAVSDTVIRLSIANEDVIGKVDYVNNTKNVVSLKEFAFVNYHVDKRSAVRVQLFPPLNVMLNVDGNRISGSVMDISLDGCRVSAMVRPLFEHANVVVLYLKFLHDNVVKQLEIKSRVLSISQGMPFACILLFEHAVGTEDALATFLNQHQVEIIRELKNKHTV